MWLIVMFDVPMDTKAARRDYTRFLKELKCEGFFRMQLSIYARYFPAEEYSKPNKKRIKAKIPPDGQVRLLLVTDHQFGKMESYLGKSRKKTEDAPAQMELF